MSRPYVIRFVDLAAGEYLDCLRADVALGVMAEMRRLLEQAIETRQHVPLPALVNASHSAAQVYGRGQNY